MVCGIFGHNLRVVARGDRASLQLARAKAGQRHVHSPARASVSFSKSVENIFDRGAPRYPAKHSRRTPMQKPMMGLNLWILRTVEQSIVLGSGAIASSVQ